ncbi:PAS domain-containing protein [Halohasta salina]|uniref:PAS domain-containing protein n=1 Tax=Halohasta salina TaxID=2961621 RepID=UPI0020A44F54|nr:PAS domain-containing protein [Halohasta salina]
MVFRDNLEADVPPDEKRREQLRAARDRRRELSTGLIEQFPEPALVVDDERRLVRFKPAAEDAYGRSQADALGTPGYEFPSVSKLEATMVELDD